MGQEEYEEWMNLQSLLSEVRITIEDDEIAWGLSSSKTFTTSSLYRFLTTGGVDSKMVKRISKCKIPLKIKIFLWQAFQDRI
jgi:hypothetical protein